MQIEQLSDKNQIQAFLNQDRAYHAYALADLAEPYFQRCQWWGAKNGNGLESLALIFEALDPWAILPMGNPHHLPHILARVNLPAKAMVLGQTEDLAYLQEHYQLAYLNSMLRMTLKAKNFVPVSGQNILRLDERHLPVLIELYQNAHGNAFAPYQLKEGIFYGRFEADNLVAVAGTHIISPAYNIAAVGNVFTRPDFRGRGYAQQVTSAVCRDLLAQEMDIVLNVEAENVSAVKVYEKLGFVSHCPFVEGIGKLKRKA